MVEGYQIESLLGDGAMGSVYRARDRAGRLVALKIIGPDSPRNRFQAEAETLARLNHPGIPRVFDFAMEPVAYLAEEILEGPTLEVSLVNGALPEALAVAYSLLEVLQVIHDHGFVHRDLSPSNIVLAPQRVCIVDFGLVRILNSDLHPTRTGEILGTPHYLAPEQIDPGLGTLSPATDLFAAASLIYHMLTGRTTVQTASLPRMLRQILHDAPAPLESPNQHLEGALFKALEKDPAARYTSALEFAQALRSAEGQERNL